VAFQTIIGAMGVLHITVSPSSCSRDGQVVGIASFIILIHVQGSLQLAVLKCGFVHL
jgi:hypothetical protein